MSDDLLVECPIHLDAVSINDILVFKCGHGFCEPCLEEHFAHGHSGHRSCPTCRKPVRRREAIPLFLTPPQTSTGTQRSHSMADAAHSRLARELKEAKAAHADCSDRLTVNQQEIDVLRRDAAQRERAMHHLRSRYEVLEGRLAKETDSFARAREESKRMAEEVAKLQVENHKTARALEQALKEVQAQVERVKVFQGYVERYKHKCNLEKKKRKAVENANQHLSKREDDSLMVVDANAPDMLHQDEPDFGWLDEACEVKGDQFTVPGDENLEFEIESGDEVQLSDEVVKGRQIEGLARGTFPRFSSDWNLGPEVLAGSSSGNTLKRRHGSKQIGGSKLVKLKMPEKPRKWVSPLVIDSQGHIKGAVALGSRQKLHSKN